MIMVTSSLGVDIPFPMWPAGSTGITQHIWDQSVTPLKMGERILVRLAVLGNHRDARLSVSCEKNCAIDEAKTALEIALVASSP